MFKKNPKPTTQLTQFLQPYCKKTKKNRHCHATKIGFNFFSILFQKKKENDLTKKPPTFVELRNNEEFIMQ